MARVWWNPSVVYSPYIPNVNKQVANIKDICRSGNFGRNEDEVREEAELISEFQKEIDQAILDESIVERQDEV